MNEIARRLLEAGTRIHEAPREFLRWTGLPEADELINDLEGHPHAFVIACLMDFQMKAELAWRIPYGLQERLGTFAFEDLVGLSRDDVERAMTQPGPLHRFSHKMSRNLYEAIQLIQRRYGGRPERIWEGTPRSGEVVSRFLEFRGAGPKIATMAANLLACHYKVPFSDYTSVDVSPDVHVKRVFGRLGLTRPDPTEIELQHSARALNPTFPGLLDFPSWEIGRNWCHATAPDCAQCYMHDICPTGGSRAGQTSN